MPDPLPAAAAPSGARFLPQAIAFQHRRVPASKPGTWYSPVPLVGPSPTSHSSVLRETEDRSDQSSGQSTRSSRALAHRVRPAQAGTSPPGHRASDDTKAVAARVALSRKSGDP